MPPAVRDFVADATAHRNFIGYSAPAAALVEKAGGSLDPGLIALNKAGDCDGFIAAGRKLR
jgi:catalase